MTTLSPAQRSAVVESAEDGTLCVPRNVADALIRAGLAEATSGDVYRISRYSRTTQKVYGVRTGARLNAAGFALRAELTK